MKDAQPKAIKLEDYREPDFWISETHLEFDLYEEYALVRSRLLLERNQNADKKAALVLHGQDMELITVSIDGKELALDSVFVEEESLTINDVPDKFEFTCHTKILPQKNTSLEGLYKSKTMFCTQCEAEGFRKITYYLDRPDVMSEFTTKITADKTAYPVLLSNGNPVGEGDCEGDAEEGRHWAKWHDPFKKPAYLFALVAGNLCNIDDKFVTQSGREILLRIFVEDKDRDKVSHALQSLKKAMRWDEDVYGREYDLDIFMIVAVDDFNMGAMENKGLNIFNTSCVLANQQTTTDGAFQHVEAVVAHEYFHNWSGNRVTCRDWFQLSLKEGFTVFRDSEFSADMNSPTVKRIQDVSFLRTAQFAEDGGPMAHPVRPSSYIEISNFYTLTVYEKGAEVVRMLHTLLGPELFRKGSDLYFERHDGQAVTVEDFVAAMSDVSGRDFSQFMHWYRQAGTPVLKVKGEFDKASASYTLKVSQSCPATPESAEKQPYHIPFRLGLLGESGELPLVLQGEQEKSQTQLTTRVLEVTKAEQTFVFQGVSEEPVPSLLRGFSAPVKLQYNYSRDELARLMRLDPDGYCRWDASQQLALQVIQSVMHALGNEPSPDVDERLLEAFAHIMQDKALDPAMVALMLQLPSEDYLSELATTIEVETIHHARNRVRRKLARSLFSRFESVYMRLSEDGDFKVDAASIANRSLRNLCLQYLVYSGQKEGLEYAHKQFNTASNMTDNMAALLAIVHSGSELAQTMKASCLERFYEKWKGESLVVNQWFSVQATSPLPGTLKTVQQLMQHEAFDFNNPNKLRALVGSFAMRNPINFHERSGAGYRFLADQVIELNKRNPQIASRLLSPLSKWKKYDENRQTLMCDQLRRIQSEPKLSKDVYEVVSKSL